MRREIQGIKRVGSVSSTDAVHRMNQYRAGLSARDWGISQRARIEGATPVAIKPVAPGQAQAPAPLPELLQLPLFVTRDSECTRSWSDLEQTLQRLNTLFAACQIEFVVSQPAEGSRPANGQDCPFAEDLDHEYDWLHLALVPSLPEDKPFLPSCGRCCFISDRCDERSMAQGLVQLLGIGLVREALKSEQLMSTSGSGTEITPNQRSWIRWHAQALLGHPLEFPQLTLPVWSYLVESPLPLASGRSENEIRQLLEKVNRVYAQAGIVLEAYNWCHLSEEDQSLAQWQQVFQSGPQSLAKLSEFGPYAAHLFFVKDGPPCVPAPEQFLIQVGDQLQTERTRGLARAFAAILGLKEVGGRDQLMAAAGNGFRLSVPEILRLRWRVTQRITRRPENRLIKPATVTTQGSDPKSPAPFQTMALKLRVFVVRTPYLAVTQTLEEVKGWLDGVKDILAAASVDLEILSLTDCHPEEESLRLCLPNPPGYTGDRKNYCSGLTRADGYDVRAVNLFILRQVPLHGEPKLVVPFATWCALKVAVVSTQHSTYSREKQITLALCALFGMNTVADAPFYRLLGRKTGTRFQPDEIERLRNAVQEMSPSLKVTPGKLAPIAIPLKVHLIDNPENGYPKGIDEFLQLMQQVNLIWSQANIVWEVSGVQRVALAENELAQIYSPHSSTPDKRKASPKVLESLADPEQVNLFLARTVPYFEHSSLAGNSLWRGQRLLLVADQQHRIDPVFLLAYSLAAFLNLSLHSDLPQYLTCKECKGTEFKPADIPTARQNAQELKACFPRNASPPGAKFTIPLRVLAVRNSRYGTKWPLEEIRSAAQQLNELFAPVHGEIELRWCQDVILPDGPIEQAMPVPPAEKATRQKSVKALESAAGYEKTAMNLFLVDQISNGQSDFDSSPSPAQRIQLVTTRNALGYPTAKVLGRAVLYALGLNWSLFASVDSVRGRGQGAAISPQDADFIRSKLAQYLAGAQSEVSIFAEMAVKPQPSPGLEPALPFDPPEPRLTLPIRLKLVSGQGLDAEQISQRLGQDPLWQQLNVCPEIKARETLEVPLPALQEAYPNAPGILQARTPFNFGLMRVPGHDVSAVNLFVVQHLPWVGREGSAQFSAFPLTRMLLAAAHPGGSLRAGLAHLLGLGEEPLTPERAETARANLRKMFHSSMSST